MSLDRWNRREALLAAGAFAASPALGFTGELEMLTRPVPGSGERLPVIGLGTYEVFESTPELVKVL